MIAETNDYLGEALIGLEVCQELGLPAHGHLRERPGRSTTYDGYDYVEACRILADHGATVVGLNCSRGPATMLPLLERDPRGGRRRGRGAAGPVPDLAGDAGLRGAGDGRRPARRSRSQLEPFQCTRFEMADFALRARDIGVDYIGICCGGGPHHVRAMAEALGRETPASRYSPAIELHPVLGTPTSRTEVMGGWAAADL